MDKSLQVTTHKTGKSERHSCQAGGWSPPDPRWESREGGSLSTQVRKTPELFCLAQSCFSPRLFLFWLEPAPSVNHPAQARLSIICTRPQGA